jgi:hypothetical protein
MCTYVTEHATVKGAGKGPARWIEVNQATVYFDHPQRAMADHTLNIDFLDRSAGPSARVAVELTVASALELVRAIEAALAAVPPALLDGEVAGPPPAVDTTLAAVPPALLDAEVAGIPGE